MTEAAFSQPEIDVVEVHHYKANVASRGVPKGLGFSYVGELPDAVDASGEAGAECVWRMRRTDWKGIEACDGRIVELCRAAD